MWRTTFLVLTIALLLLVARAPDAVDAKGGGSLVVTPDSGELGTTVELRSDFWTPDAEVKIYAGFSAALYEHEGGVPVDVAEPERWWGPIAQTRSDERSQFNPQMGSWSVTLVLDSTAEVPLPNGPGFIMLKAVTEGEVTDDAQVTGKSEVTDFALTVDGARPAGAGVIRGTITAAPEAGAISMTRNVAGVAGRLWLTVARVQEPLMSPPEFIVTQMGPLPVPFEYQYLRRSDGVYYILVFDLNALLDPERQVVPEGAGVVEIDARLRLTSGPDSFEMAVRVKRVEVRNGEVVEGADMTLVPKKDATPVDRVEVLPAAGSGPTSSSVSEPLYWSILVAAVGVALIVLGWHLRSRGPVKTKARV